MRGRQLRLWLSRRLSDPLIVQVMDSGINRSARRMQDYMQTACAGVSLRDLQSTGPRLASNSNFSKGTTPPCWTMQRRPRRSKYYRLNCSRCGCIQSI